MLQVGKLSGARLDSQFHHRMNLPNGVVRHVLSTVSLIFRCMAYVPERFPTRANFVNVHGYFSQCFSSTALTV
jgi:hypothetical protein